VESLLTAGEVNAARMESASRSADHPRLANAGRLVSVDSVDRSVPALFPVLRDISARGEHVCQDVLGIMTVRTKSFAWQESVKIHAFLKAPAVLLLRSAECQTTALSASAPRDCRETPKLSANALNAKPTLNVSTQRVVLRALA